MNDPEVELSERERRQDPELIDWGTDIPFQGESVPGGVSALAAQRRPAWRLRQWRLAHPLAVTDVETLNAAAIDAEVMTYEQWRQHWCCDGDGDLVTR